MYNFWWQAKAAKELNVQGIFIRSADTDDWKGTCTCDKYAALQVIKDEFMKGEKNPKSTCSNYGLLEENRT